MYIKLLNALNKLFQLGNIAQEWIENSTCYLGVNRCDCVEVFEPVIIADQSTELLLFIFNGV